jgi:polar amino acid transport system substrate-binding protein
MRTLKGVTALVFVAAVAAACSSGSASPSAVPTAAATPSTVPTVAATPAPTSAPTAAPTLDACAKDSLAVTTAGKLTIGTDNPAYPPYFDPPASGEPKTDPWELGDPTNGRGFESAVAYAVADKLGFAKGDVTWVYVPFDSSYAPGPKAFDMDINQVSYTADRAKAVDMSDGYYTVNQALVANADTPITKVTTVSGLKDFRFGAQQGTTSYQFIVDTIKPTNEASVYNDNTAAIAALNVPQIDGIVVDLPTAFYITAAQMDHGVIVGQFPAPTGADAEHFSIVLGKGSALTACVNRAIAALKTDGTLDALTKTWLSDKASAPVLQP